MISKVNNLCMGKISHSSDLNSHFPLHFEIVIEFTNSLQFIDLLIIIINFERQISIVYSSFKIEPINYLSLKINRIRAFYKKFAIMHFVLNN